MKYQFDQHGRSVPTSHVFENLPLETLKNLASLRMIQNGAARCK